MQERHQKTAGMARSRQAGDGPSSERVSATGDGFSPDFRDLELLAWWLDSRFRIPGTKIRFGLDSVLGLVPGIGDAATTVPAAYLLYRAHRLGVPTSLLARMGANVAVDLVVGAIPIVGDIFDVGFKANRRNVDLLRRHLERARHTRFDELP